MTLTSGETTCRGIQKIPFLARLSWRVLLESSDDAKTAHPRNWDAAPTAHPFGIKRCLRLEIEVLALPTTSICQMLR